MFFSGHSGVNSGNSGVNGGTVVTVESISVSFVNNQTFGSLLAVFLSVLTKVANPYLHCLSEMSQF